MGKKRNEKSLRKNRKLYWNGKTMFVITAITCIAAVIFAITKADAAYAGNYNDIGTYNDTAGGKSINGVRISKNSEILNYALDMWEKTSNNEWKYTASNIDGYVSDIESSGSYPVFINGKSEPRFGINMNSIKNRLPQNGSIVIRKYRKGRLIYERTELTYQTENENEVEDSVSLLKQAAKGTSRLELPSTDYSFDGVSYIYDIYDAAVIGQSGDIYTALDDCRIISEGYAYYGAEGEYIIRELPVAEHNEMDGYTCSFDGWYTHEGYKICVGDAIDLRTTVYPRWDISPVPYNVNYIDILGDQPDGKVLGTSTLTAYYNDEASGSDIGSDESAGAYYAGLYYTGCTSATVQGDCDVYRYFRPASYNIVFNGNMSASGETAPLYGCIYGETYKLTENGFKRNGTVTLDLNAEDAICTTKNINVAYEFKGWSEIAGGGTVYTDCESVSDLCREDGEKQLYAVWDGGSVEVSAVPEREGYRFDGWSKDQSGTSGNTWFDVSDGNDCTLYAVWIKKQEETNNGGNGTGGSAADGDGNGGTISGGSTASGDAGNGESGDTDSTDRGETSENTGGGNGNSGTGGNTDGANENSGDSASTDGGSENSGNGSSTDNGGGNGSSTASGDNASTDSGSENSGNGSSTAGESGNSDGTASGSGNSSSTNNTIGNSGNSGSTGNTGNVNGNSSTNGGSKGNSITGNNTGKENSGNGNSGGKGNNVNTDSSAKPASGSGISSGSKNPSEGSQDTGSGNTTIANNSNNSSTNINNNSTASDGNAIIHNPDISTDNKKDKASKNSAVYPEAGKKYKKSGIIYKIIKSSNKERTVKVIKATKNITKAKIPGSIKIKGYKYKVMSIAKKAFIKCSQLKKAVIGKNIKSIGKKAFYKNKALGSITIKSKKLKSIGKSAFKRIKPKCAVKIAGSKKYSQKVFAMMNT